MRMRPMKLRNETRGNRRTGWVEVLHQQRNFDGRQNAIEVAIEIAFTKGEYSRHGRRYGRGSGPLRFQGGFDSLPARHKIHLREHRNPAGSALHRFRDKPQLLILRQLIKLAGICRQADGARAGRAGKINQRSECGPIHLLLLRKRRRNDRNNALQAQVEGFCCHMGFFSSFCKEAARIRARSSYTVTRKVPAKTSSPPSINWVVIFSRTTTVESNTPKTGNR